MIQARVFDNSDLAKCEFIDGFGTNHTEIDYAGGYTVFDKKSGDILAIVLINNDIYIMDDVCKCNKTLRVGVVFAMFCEAGKRRLKGNMRYGFNLMHAMALEDYLDLIVACKDINNQLGDKFLRLMGFTKANAPSIKADDREFVPYQRKFNKDVAICDNPCYLRQDTNQKE